MKKANDKQLEALFTEEELAMIKAQRAQYQKAWWAKLTPAERRAKRARYVLHTAQNKAKAAAAAAAQEPAGEPA